MSRWFNNVRAVAASFLLLCAGYVWTAQSIPLDFWSETEPFNARSMPYLIGWTGIAVSLLMLLAPSRSFDWSGLKQLNVMPAVILFLLLATYGFAIERLGFVGSTILLLVLGFVVLGERRPMLISLMAVAMAAGFWLLMDLLGIYLNPGEWFL
jgi:putative tricarboxylic transport membrane protein